MSDGLLDLHTTQTELEAQWLILLQRYVDINANAYRLARYAEARAIVAGRKMIAERDAEIERLRAQLEEKEGQVAVLSALNKMIIAVAKGVRA